ncbi:hypothetical protein BTVI_04352 [Pitangus sulphuratus]|nr:hypothetical protein BTVI_04352 [Pitangus sulphuratus]
MGPRALPGLLAGPMVLLLLLLLLLLLASCGQAAAPRLRDASTASPRPTEAAGGAATRSSSSSRLAEVSAPPEQGQPMTQRALSVLVLASAALIVYFVIRTVRHKNFRAFLQTFNQVTCSVDEGKTVDVAYVDFSKSLDTVLHGTLLDKLSNCGVSRFTVHWVKRRRNDRAQRVVVKTRSQSPVVLLRAQFYGQLWLRRRNRKTRRYGVLDTNIENMELTPLEQDDDDDDTTLFDANHPRSQTFCPEGYYERPHGKLSEKDDYINWLLLISEDGTLSKFTDNMKLRGCIGLLEGRKALLKDWTGWIDDLRPIG